VSQDGRLWAIERSKYLGGSYDLVYGRRIEAFRQDRGLRDIQDLHAGFASARHRNSPQILNQGYSTASMVFANALSPYFQMKYPSN